MSGHSISKGKENTFCSNSRLIFLNSPASVKELRLILLQRYHFWQLPALMHPSAGIKIKLVLNCLTSQVLSIKVAFLERSFRSRLWRGYDS